MHLHHTFEYLLFIIRPITPPFVRSYFIFIVSERNYEMVKSLYALGANEKLADKNGCDAMMKAASIGNK